jgi:hypothetical protein
MARRKNTPDQPQRGLARRAPTVSGHVENYDPGEDDPDAPQEQDLERFGDVTITCKGCGTEFYDDATVCWNCGRSVMAGDRAGGVPTWAIVAGLAALFAFLLVLTTNII